MSTPPTNRPPTPMSARPNQAGPGGGTPAVTLDPVKLVKKYLLVLIAAGVVSVVLGFMLFSVMARVAPSYRSFVIFEAKIPQADIGTVDGTQPLDDGELERFVGTQVNLMKSDAILDAVARNPRLASDAPQYASEFMVNNVPDADAIRNDLKNHVSARAIPETYFIELACTARRPNEAAELTRMLKEAYLNELSRQSNRDANQQRDIIRRSIAEAETRIDALRAQRDRLMQENNIETLDDRSADVSQTLGRITGELVQISLAIEATQVEAERLNEQLESPTGVVYDDELIAGAEMDPRVARTRGQLDSLRTSLKTLRESGFMDAHRDVINVQSAIRASEARMEEIRQVVLRQQFEARIEGAERTLAQLNAQRVELESEREDARLARLDITTVRTEVSDLNRRVLDLEQARANQENKLANLEALAERDAANRVVERFRESIPDGLASPKLKVVGAATVFVIMGLVSGLIVLRELLDQRVKTPADVAMIPRTRIVGVIPSASEDPTKSELLETSFRDSPRGVIAEHFRQLRGQISKRLASTENATLVVIPCSPGSGATSVVTNLGLASAASHSRTLLIDANFRRPRLAEIFKLGDTEGLGDVLKGNTSLDEAIRADVEEHLDVLTAGTKGARVFELLGTRGMADLLAEAKKHYDLIIVDAPPALVAGDGAMMANRADASLLVARAMNEQRGMVARLKNEISESRGEFLGVVVNDVRAAAGGYMRRNIKLTHRYHADAVAEKAPRPKKRKGKGDDSHGGSSNGRAKTTREADDLIPETTS